MRKTLWVVSLLAAAAMGLPRCLELESARCWDHETMGWSNIVQPSPLRFGLAFLLPIQVHC